MRTNTATTSFGSVLRRAARGFTLTEMVVAVGVTLLLLVGVGRLFITTRGTISTGAATAEVSQMARTLENLMREDFANMVRQEGFLVVRNERIGRPATPQRILGTHGPNVTDPRRTNQRDAIYLNADAQERGENLLTDDRPVRRLDQIAFFATGEHTSYQYRHRSYGQNQPMVQGVIARNDTAPVARIWYGHGLRAPHPDVIDGIKSQLGLNGYNAFFADPRNLLPSPPPETDRVNFYAGDWVLARQPALLLTRDSAECDRFWDSNFYQSGEYHALAFAPSLIEIFNEIDTIQQSGETYWNWPYFYPIPAGAPGWQSRLIGQPDNHLRRFSAGYVDIIDMDLPAVKRAVTEYGRAYNRETGRIEEHVDPLEDRLGRWARGDWVAHRSVKRMPDYVHQLFREDLRSVAEAWTYHQRLRMMYSTGRIRVESVAPSADRWSQMLTHASLLPGCSNFEIAWSTGEFSFPEGHLVWYDINNPANPHVRFHYNERSDRTPPIYQGTQEILERTPSDPRVWYLSEALPPPALAHISDQAKSFSLVPAPSPTTEATAPDLYYATFGPFVPRVGDDHRHDPWPWPRLIRVRATLHDPQGRLQGGRDYEFIFRVPPLPSERS